MVFVPWNAQEALPKHPSFVCVCLPSCLKGGIYAYPLPLLRQEYLGWMSMAIDLLSLAKVMNKKWFVRLIKGTSKPPSLLGKLMYTFPKTRGKWTPTVPVTGPPLVGDSDWIYNQWYLLLGLLNLIRTLYLSLLIFHFIYRFYLISLRKGGLCHSSFMWDYLMTMMGWPLSSGVAMVTAESQNQSTFSVIQKFLF